jgi:hypothetical protein
VLICNFSGADVPSSATGELAFSTAPSSQDAGIVPACSAALYLANG